MPVVPSRVLSISPVNTASLTAEMDAYIKQFEQYSLECIDNAYRYEESHWKEIHHAV